MHVGVSLSPGDIGDLGDDGLEHTFCVVRKIEGHWVELVPEVPRMRQQVHVGDVGNTKCSVDPIANLIANRKMLIESKITLLPAGQILLI